MFQGWHHVSRAARRFSRESRAASAAEFALVAPVVIAVILATLQAGIIFVAKAYLETGAEQAARTVLTNNATTTTGGVTSPMTQAQFQAAVCALLPALFTCGSLIVELEPLPSGTTSVATLTPTFNSDGTLANPVTYQSGTSGQLMFLLVAYEWPVYGGVLGLNFGTLGNGTLLMTSTQIFKIEI
jgi:Flp pilus assembly protein TadG